MNLRALLAEFIGTFAIVFIGVGAIVADHLTNGAVGLTGIALAFGFIVAAVATATIPISGGHLNPAVSFSMLISGNMGVKEFIAYIIVQCLGALAASSLMMSANSPLSLEAVNFGIPMVGESATPGMAAITEIVLTFLLVFVIFSTAVDKQAPKLGGLLIGLTVAVDVLMGGPVSGGSMNPARWLGPAVIGGDYMNGWLYWVGPFAGGALAAIVYTSVFQDKQNLSE